MDKLTFVHTADFHFGADLRRYGSVAEVVEKAQFDALDKILQSALDYKAAFVLICGDLFNSRAPGPKISRKVFGAFADYSSLRVFVIPGTHDYLSDGSIFSRSEDLPPNLTLLTKKLSPLFLDEFDTCLYFNPNRSNKSATSPIAGFERQPGPGFHIGVAHGSLDLGGIDVGYDFPISPDLIEKSGLDYLALGHWHKPSEYKFGNTELAYPGIPQPLSFSDPDEGHARVVIIGSPKGINIEKITTSTVSFKLVDETIYHPYELEKVLESHADPSKIIKLNLKFSDNLKEYPEIERLLSRYASRFLFMDTPDSKSNRPAIAPAGVSKPQVTLLIESYLEEIKRLKSEDSEERQELYQKAAELGTAIIKGEI